MSEKVILIENYIEGSILDVGCGMKNLYSKNAEPKKRVRLGMTDIQSSSHHWFCDVTQTRQYRSSLLFFTAFIDKYSSAEIVV